MEGADALLGGLAGGDKLPAPQAPAAAPGLKRDHDSTDDFEHLERERQEAGESPLHTARMASQGFLDMERDEFAEPRAPSATERLADQLADKFTDSESDADTAGESPLHRSAATAPPAAAPEPALLHFEPATPPITPKVVAAPQEPTPPKETVPAPAPHPEPAAPEIKPQPKPEPPSQPREPTPPPKASAPPPPEVSRAPVAHVIEAEVIFCQMGLGEWWPFCGDLVGYFTSHAKSAKWPLDR